jgi:hypothetical protein
MVIKHWFGGKKKDFMCMYVCVCVAALRNMIARNITGQAM